MLGSTFLLSDDDDLISGIIGDDYEEGHAFAIITMNADAGAVIEVDEDGEAAEWTPFNNGAKRKDVLEALDEGAFFVLSECGCDRLYTLVEPRDRKTANFCKDSGFRRLGMIEGDIAFERVI
jgi:hypothetical protein